MQLELTNIGVNMQPTTFINRISNVVSNLDRDVVKAAIGDSIYNNRSLTVNQVARYLTTRRDKNLKRLGKRLQAVGNSLSLKMQAARAIRGASRTDAFDINELIDTVGKIVADQESHSFSYYVLEVNLERA